jgi:hypothetical protein
MIDSHAPSYSMLASAGSQAVFTSHKFFLCRGLFVYYLVECLIERKIDESSKPFYEK